MFSGSQKQQFQNGKIPGGKMKKPGFMGNMMNSNTMGQALPLMFEPPDPSAMVADLTQMSQQEATAGNVTVLLSKMAEDTTCGN